MGILDLLKEIGPYVGTIGGAVAIILSLAQFVPQWRNTESDTYEKLSNAIDKLSERLEKEREAREADARRCAENVANLQMAANYANQRLERVLDHIRRRFGVEISTDDLKTPPPHVVPADPTPPLPTRSTFQDVPNDQPPDDAA